MLKPLIMPAGVSFPVKTASMTKKITAWLSSLFLIATFGCPQALANGEHYDNYAAFQIYYASEEYESDSGTTIEDDHGFMGGTYGKMFNDIFSVEGRVGFTSNSGYKNGTTLYGGYLRARKKMDSIGFYGLLGYGGIYTYAEDEDSESEGGLSYGAGLEFFGSDSTAITIEYISLFDDTDDNDNDHSLTAINLGISYYFGVKESAIKRSGSLRTN